MGLLTSLTQLRAGNGRGSWDGTCTYGVHTYIHTFVHEGSGVRAVHTDENAPLQKDLDGIHVFVAQ